MSGSTTLVKARPSFDACGLNLCPRMIAEATLMTASWPGSHTAAIFGRSILRLVNAHGPPAVVQIYFGNGN
jgi:hypothetical protein